MMLEDRENEHVRMRNPPYVRTYLCHSIIGTREITINSYDHTQSYKLIATSRENRLAKQLCTPVGPQKCQNLTWVTTILAHKVDVAHLLIFSAPKVSAADVL